MKTTKHILVIAVLSFFFNTTIQAAEFGGNSPSETITTELVNHTKEVLLYPSPNYGVFSTELPFSIKKTDYKVSVYDQNGQLSEFSKETVSEGLLLFNLDEQPAGNYTLVIEADGRTYVNSFQKVD